MQTSADLGDLDRARLLVVDDDHDVRAALVAELAPAYAVDAFATGEEAIAALVERAYDVVIADLHLPGASGADVLEHARVHRADAIPILLTGHLDDRAAATPPGVRAPYRVGKPWHDELELIVRHALADRAAGGASPPPVSAEALAALDAALDDADEPHAVARHAAAAGARIAGVIAVAAIAGDHLIAGEVGRGGAWTYELVVDAGADVRLCARGDGAHAREAVALIAHRAQRRAAELCAAGVTPAPAARAKGTGKHELLRRATVGSLTAVLLHDVASSMQGLQATVEVLCEIAAESPELEDAARDVAAAGQATIATFLAIRKFIRTGELALRVTSPATLVARAVRVVRNPRTDVSVNVGAMSAGDAEVVVAEVLFERILANLISTAIAASPPGGAVGIDAGRDGDRVVFTVTDEGDGDRVGDELVIEATESDESEAVGLAVAAHLAQLHGASLRRARSSGRGRVFTLTVGAER